MKLAHGTFYQEIIFSNSIHALNNYNNFQTNYAEIIITLMEEKENEMPIMIHIHEINYLNLNTAFIIYNTIFIFKFSVF